MLAGSLDLEEPWYITGAKFDPVKSVINVYDGIREDAVIVCPRCGGSTKRYGYEPTERSWRHADCLFYPCYVHCRRPRVKCDKCGVQQVTAPFERQNSRHTLLFEGYAMMIMEDVPRRKASRLLCCNEKTLASIRTQLLCLMRSILLMKPDLWRSGDLEIKYSLSLLPCGMDLNGL